jgi:hypothetical protein
VAKPTPVNRAMQEAATAQAAAIQATEAMVAEMVQVAIVEDQSYKKLVARKDEVRHHIHQHRLNITKKRSGVATLERKRATMAALLERHEQELKKLLGEQESIETRSAEIERRVRQRVIADLRKREDTKHLPVDELAAA